MIADDAVLRVRRPVRYRVIGGEGVVVVQDEAHVVGLNPTGVAVLRLLDGERNVGDVVRALAAAYEADPARLRADVAALAGELVRLGVVETVDTPTGGPA